MKKPTPRTTAPSQPRALAAGKLVTAAGGAPTGVWKLGNKEFADDWLAPV